MHSLTTYPIARKLTAGLAALTLSVGFAAPAMAQDATGGYDDEAGAVEGQIQGSTPTRDEGTPVAEEGTAGDQVTKSSSGNNETLPFTGFETSVVLALGLALGALGLGLRRIARPPA